MATDATGAVSTNFGFPKYLTSADAPSGLGLNAIVDDVDSKLGLVTTLLGAVGRTIVRKAGVLVGTRRAINFIEGTGITLTMADDSGSEEVDVTIAATGASGPAVLLPLVAPNPTATSYGVSVANDSYMLQIWAPTAFTVNAVNFRVGAQSGNMDVAIYNAARTTRLWSRGSVAVPAVGVNTIAVSAGTPTILTLTSGTYWLAIAFDNIVATVKGVINEAPTGLDLVKFRTSSFPLPADASSAVSLGSGNATMWAGLS